jgi:hypothetical protein
MQYQEDNSGSIIPKISKESLFFWNDIGFMKTKKEQVIPLLPKTNLSE